jgi:inosine-uridine nucleoside N-ribohydrolase
VHRKGPLPLVVDTDPGIDDAVALALAIRAAPTGVAAIVTVFGNTSLDAATRNARTVAALAGGDVAVRPGSDRPLMGTADGDPTRHGPEGIGYAPVPPAPPVTANSTALLEALTNQPPGVLLVTLGPLTNLACALRADEALVRSRVHHHWAMAGTFRERGSATHAADFNLWADPDAADAVLAADLGTRLVPLDLTRRVRVTAVEVQRCSAHPDPLVRWLGGALRFSLERVPDGAPQAVAVNDAAVVVAALAPAALAFEARRLKIGGRNTDQRGRLIEDPAGHTVAIATHIDVPRVRHMLGRVLPIETESGGE